MVGRRTGASSSLRKAWYCSGDTVISAVLYLSIWFSISFNDYKEDERQKYFGMSSADHIYFSFHIFFPHKNLNWMLLNQCGTLFCLFIDLWDIMAGDLSNIVCDEGEPLISHIFLHIFLKCISSY